MSTSSGSDAAAAEEGSPACIGSSCQELDYATCALRFSPAGTTTQAVALSATLAAANVYTIYAYGCSDAVAAVLTKDN
jgi:hypothetical protein